MTCAERIRLGVLVPHRGMSGAETNIASLLQHLQTNEFDICLIAPSGQPLLEMARKYGHSAAEMEFPRFYSTSIEVGARRFLNPFSVIYDVAGILRMAMVLQHFVKQNGIQVLYAGSMMAHLMAAFIRRFNPEIRIVLHIQEVVSSSMARGLGRRFLAKIASMADQVVVISQAVAQSLQTNWTPTLVYNGVDVDFYQSTTQSSLRDELRIDGDTPLVGIVGRLTPWKGHITFLEAAQCLAQNDLSCHYLVVGDSVDPVTGTTSYRSTLEALRDKLGLRGKMTFLGYRKDIPNIMRGLDVIVVPSIRPEPFGLVAIEAMACGKPVVASQIGGLPEIVMDHVTGLLVPPSDPGALANALRELISEADLRKRYGTAGLERVRENFRLAHYVESMKSVFCQLAGG